MKAVSSKEISIFTPELMGQLDEFLGRLITSDSEKVQFLGLGRSTIDRLLYRGDIRSYVRIGKRRLFDPDELIEWAKNHGIVPVKKKNKKGGRENG